MSGVAVIPNNKKGFSPRPKPDATTGGHYFFVDLPSMNVIQLVPSTETSNFMV